MKNPCMRDRANKALRAAGWLFFLLTVMAILWQAGAYEDFVRSLERNDYRHGVTHEIPR